MSETELPIATVVVPVRTVSEANRHEHWRYRQKRAQLHNFAVWSHLNMRRIALGKQVAMPVHVHITRIAPRKLDTDNLAGSQKFVRDAVAKFLGVDDGNEAMVTWSYGQEQAKKYQVRIDFYRGNAQARRMG